MQTIQLHQCAAALRAEIQADPQRGTILLALLAFIAIAAIAHAIDRLITRHCARRDARRNKVQMLGQDPRQAKHLLNLYCASAAEANERDWINSAHMAATRRKAKAHLS